MTDCSFPRWVLTGAFFLGTSSVSWAGFINGDFSSSLEGSWSTSGTIARAGEVAVITDDTPVNVIWQEVVLLPGQYLFRFDILPAPSPVVPQGTFNDALFGSIYYHPNTDSIFDPVAPSGFSSVTPLFDLDATGSVIYEGGFTPSIKGGDWKTYTATVTISEDNAVLVLDLRDLNGIAGDSTIALDNFSAVFVPIPEASTFLLPLAVGLFVWQRRRHSRNA